MVFSVLAFIAIVISICIPERKKSLGVQSLNCLCEALYDYTISAYTGAVLGILNFIRTLLFINKEKFAKIFYLLILIIFECLLVINCVYTWAGVISLLPTTASIIRTYCLWQTNMKIVRISGVIAGLLYGIYYIYYRSPFMILGYFLLMIAAIISIYKYDIKKNA